MSRFKSLKLTSDAPDKNTGSPATSGAERRYSARYTFNAAAETLDLDTGARSSGRLTELSSDGCFIATSQPLALRSRVNLRVSREKETVGVLATVRTVKPGAGMGLEFLDIEPAHLAILQRWLAALRER